MTTASTPKHALAEETSVFSHLDFTAGPPHEQVVFCRDATSGLHAIIAVHSTVLGPALGGTRDRPGRRGPERSLTSGRRIRTLRYPGRIDRGNRRRFGDRPRGGLEQLRYRRVRTRNLVAGQTDRPGDRLVRRCGQGVRASVSRRGTRGRAVAAGNPRRAAARRRCRNPGVLHARGSRHPCRRRRAAVAVRRCGGAPHHHESRGRRRHRRRPGTAGVRARGDRGIRPRSHLGAAGRRPPSAAATGSEFGALDHTVEVDRIAGTIRRAISGGAAMPVEILTRFAEDFGVQILEGYGLSETSPLALFTDPERDPRPGSIGVPVWGVEARLVDGDWRTVEGPGPGEIVLRGHNVMKGYLGRPEATAQVRRDGWFRTGDLARRDDDGYYYIVDRAKDLIVRNGFNVYPREVEEVLMTHAAVSLAAVIGVPHESLGEEVKAYVILAPSARISEAELIAWCRDQMAGYKYPRSIEFTTDLPMTATGKILERELAGRV